MDLVDEFTQWLNAATLAKIGRGDFLQVDMQRIEPAAAESLPETLVTYSQMTDKIRYAVLHDFNDRIDYRKALDLNEAETARFDSDESVSDGEL